MGAGDLTPVSVEVVFERFPASVRGAVVVRGADRDPHQVSLEDAEVVEAPAGKPVRSLELGAVTVDVAPRREVLIPFEVPFAELDPGWYAVTAEVIVDGQRRVRGPEGTSPRFVVGWPGGEVRRGSVVLDLPIAVPESEGAVVERVECRADSAVVRWRHAPSGGTEHREFDELKVKAGRRLLPILEDSFEPRTGRRTTTTYPVLSRHRTLTFELGRRHPPEGRPRRGRWSATVELP